jgi:predicted tellurium resistance membrane protein TerC
MNELFSTESLVSFLVLTILEVVLGIDNVIFVSLIINRLHESNKKKARRAWMITGIIIRSLLLLGLSWLLAQRGKAIFTIGNHGFDLASLVMLCGGLFLIYKSVKEIHGKLEGEDPDAQLRRNNYLSLGKAIVQIMLIDTVFLLTVLLRREAQQSMLKL